LLIVEDNEADSTLAEIALEDAGVDAEVRVETSLAGALDSLQAYSADIVLLDMGLPDIEGLQGLHEIVAHAPFVPVVLLTGTNNEQIGLQALECGAEDYLVKDEYTPDLLARAIRYAIERKRSALALLGAARYDPVTGLINRAYFINLLDHALDRAKRNATEVHVLFLDLDHFKNINDTLGHAAGDELLREVGARLEGAVRQSDVVARLGGDEFTVMVEDAESASTSVAIAKKIIEAMQPSFPIAGVDVMMTPSIGIAGFPDAGTDSATLVRHADTAMYRAKSSGRNTIELFSDDMAASVREIFELEMSLRHAITAGEFELYYQPIVDDVSGAICSAEASLRWNREGKADAFKRGDILMALETSSLICELGEWALRAACRQCGLWQKTLQSSLRVSVKVSPRQIETPGFVATVEHALRDTRLDGKYLVLQIPERALLQPERSPFQTLSRLRALGVAIAISDFGAGYSALLNLDDCPIDSAKIDQGFAKQASVRGDNGLLAAGVQSIAKGLGWSIVTDGVETGTRLDVSPTLEFCGVLDEIDDRPLSTDRFEICLAQQQLPIAAASTR
jgi:diguanylate cyclase (GGDEF)-like protein